MFTHSQLAAYNFLKTKLYLHEKRKWKIWKLDHIPNLENLILAYFKNALVAAKIHNPPL